MKVKALCLLVIFVFAVSAVVADVIVKPVSVTSTVAGDAGSSVNYLLNDNSGRAGESLHDTAGNAVALTNGVNKTVAMATLARHRNDGQYESWTAPTSSGAPVFVFDLGEDKSINSAILWQYGNWGGNVAHAGENDVQDFRMILHTAAEGNTFDFSTETADLDDTATRMQNRETNGNVAQDFSFTTATARYVAMTIDSNYGGSRNGLGEVRFAIPEPATLSLLGLTGLAIFFRRRFIKA